jgi:hypothetical protein
MSNETATFLEFASRFGWKQSYVTQLKKDGRLALTGDGKAIRVAESLALIETTRDPSRAGVAARHAQARTKAAADAQVEPTEAKDSGYQHWRERGERAKALGAERDNAIADGKLLDRDETIRTLVSATTRFRINLENLPSILAPQLAAMTDEDAIVAILSQAFGEALKDLSRKFSAIAREEKAR